MFHKCLSLRTLQGPHPLPLKSWGLNTKEQFFITLSNCSQIAFSFDSHFVSVFILLYGKCFLTALNDCHYTKKWSWVMKCSSSLCSSLSNRKFEGSQCPARLNNRWKVPHAVATVSGEHHCYGWGRQAMQCLGWRNSAMRPPTVLPCAQLLTWIPDCKKPGHF